MLIVAPRAVVSAQAASVMTDLMKDVDGVQQKLVALAKAMPQDKYGARPGAGVRSVGEVFMHVASDNYLMPSLAGAVIPASTKLDGKDFKTFGAFEKLTVTPAQAATELETSFAFLKAEMAKTTAADLTKEVNMFGTKTTRQGLWIGTVTHLHEHLGQSIAYARQNGIVPPWSK